MWLPGHLTGITFHFRGMWFVDDCSCMEGANYSLGNLGKKEGGGCVQQLASRVATCEGR